MESNSGFDPTEIEKMRAEIGSDQSYVVIESEDNSDDFMNFYFIGKHDGKEVIFDAALYTLRLQHSSEIHEMAEHKVAQKFPDFKKISYEEDENGDIEPLDDLEEEIGLYLTEVMDELEEEDAIKVSEHIDVDEHIDFGIGLDVGLNIEKVTHESIEKFIKDFNADAIKLDETLYSFQFDPED
ncbi:hypothetical protein [Roseivirga misakiensis]|uniref:Uncharacterized protein n=1 Tax=Roseivirga misakiensis TaxID=1563681 RepID=A0A1E5SYW8_9BACT|nr:hypothetical protein [Roseivirga misakiensis]OEK04324.1 hypothetical protein BFP71_12640 [Roseivirga misakiensis]